MKWEFGKRLEAARARNGDWATATGDKCGWFHIAGPRGAILRIMASDGSDWPMDGPAWEHVSISLADRCPIWKEMVFVKDLFWDESECVLQFHPPKSQYVNCHPYCLHLWKPVGIEIPTPPSIAIGPMAARV